VDVAYAFSEKVGDFISKLRLYKGVTIIAGNVCTPEGVKFLRQKGADVVKVGIGNGSCCETRVKAGVGYPQLSAIIECSDLGIPIISDGGINHIGDIVKALAAGASMVMTGRLFAGCNEAIGAEENGSKVYRGMASKEAFNSYVGSMPDWKTAEGISGLVPTSGSARDVLAAINGGLRSGMSYCGANTLWELQEDAEVVQITPAGYREGVARVERL